MTESTNVSDLRSIMVEEKNLRVLKTELGNGVSDLENNFRRVSTC